MSPEFTRSIRNVPMPLVGHPLFCQSEGPRGHGIGLAYDFKAALLSRYESIERYTSSRVTSSTPKCKRISDLCDSKFAESVQACLTQTISDSACDLDAKFFEISTGLELSTKRNIEFPAIMSTTRPIENDDAFLPVRDTSGSATHTDATRCYQSALLEFIERQCLCVTWQTKKPKSRTVIADASSLGANAAIVRHLQKTGEVCIRDISRPFAAYTFLVTYTSRSDIHRVRYACGLSSSTVPEKALYKSIVELYQGYFHMYWLTKKPNDQNNYLDEAYLNGNKTTTANMFGDAQDVSLDELLSYPIISFPELIASVSDISTNVVYAHSMHQIEGRNFITGKVFSQDTYIHMALDRNCNLNNKLSKRCGVRNCNTPTAIPFG